MQKKNSEKRWILSLYSLIKCMVFFIIVVFAKQISKPILLREMISFYFKNGVLAFMFAITPDTNQLMKKAELNHFNLIQIPKNVK